MVDWYHFACFGMEAPVGVIYVWPSYRGMDHLRNRVCSSFMRKGCGMLQMVDVRN